MKFITCILALSLVSCVSTTAPDGTKTTSFAPSVEQLNAAAALAGEVRGKSLK